MVRPISMPKLGQSEEEAKLTRWIKKEGDPVAKGDVLFEIETDKACLDVESFFEGTLLKIVVAEGQTVPVQTTVGFIGLPGEQVPDIAIPTSAATEERTPGALPITDTSHPGACDESTAESAATETEEAATPIVAASRYPKISPRAARLAKQASIDPALIVGSGPDGRIVELDVRGYLDAKEHSEITLSARELGTSERIDSFFDRSHADQDSVAAMSPTRQLIAARVVDSMKSAPHFFVTTTVDMTDLIQFRGELKVKGVEYSLTDFISAAVVLSLKEFPVVNSATDGKNVRRHSKIHLGLVVNLDDGLIIPVIRNASDLSLPEIHQRSADLIAKVRRGGLTPEEVTGGTFTISNMGMLNVENFTAIINPGESAILAVSSVMKQPVVREDQVVIRAVSKMTLSSDHRLIDGALAAGFLNAIKSKLEDTTMWKRST